MLLRASTDHADSLFDAYASDPEVTRYLSWPTHDSVDDTEGFLSYASKAWDEGSDFIWVIAPKEQNAACGTISFSIESHRAHLGFVIARSEWSKGYMTEACRALVDWLLQQPEVLRIEALCDVENVGSARVLEKSGLEREGTLRNWMVLPNLSDEPRDMHMHSLIKRWVGSAEAKGSS